MLFWLKYHFFMPVLTTHFSTNFFLKNAHFNTMYRTFFMKENSTYQRKRITTWDDDFIDLDVSLVPSNTIAILIHGLEGSATSKYILAAVRELNMADIATVSMNLRGCSGEDNLLPTTYHSGKTDDVDFVINHIIEHFSYKNMILIGYSLGGNLTLKYMGENAHKLPKEIKGAVAISVPVDLASSGVELAKWKNKIYMHKFLKTLQLKVQRKVETFPKIPINIHQVLQSKSFLDFDEAYTAPIFGFKNANDYWQKASAKPFLKFINKPTLLINALDDPFLASACYPFTEAKNTAHFYLKTPKHGGHVGFIATFHQQKNRWLEHQILAFIKEKIGN